MVLRFILVLLGEGQSRNDSTKGEITYSVDDLFVAAMFAVSQSVLLAFTTREERRELLTAKYPHFLALAISSADARMRKQVGLLHLLCFVENVIRSSISTYARSECDYFFVNNPAKT